MPRSSTAPLLIAVVSLLCATAINAQQFNFYTIPNQSASFVRMPSRSATTDIDAVFFNPAGLTQLPAGLHLSASNQNLNQTTSIRSDYANLTNRPTMYDGELGTGFYPSAYAAYVMEDYVLSVGVNPVAGAGTGVFDNLPAAEMPVSDIPVVMHQFLKLIDESVVNQGSADPGFRNVNGYSMDFGSDGLAYYLGIQAGLSYKISDFISVALGGRYVRAKLDYGGYSKNILVHAPDKYGGLQRPGDYMRYVDEQLGPEPNILLESTASQFDELLADREVDAKQHGIGFTPIIGVNLKPWDFVNIGIKYEHRTRMSLETEVFDGKDGGVFTNGAKVASDLPSFLAIGLSYEMIPGLTLAPGFRYITNSGADYDGRQEFITSDYKEYEFAAEYQLFESLALSAGLTFAHHSVDREFQSDVDFLISGYSLAGGFQYRASSQLGINAGVIMSFFPEKSYSYDVVPADGMIALPSIPTTMLYKKSATIWALGIDYFIGTF
jgi:long-subunit fatty acid transport protein